MLSEADLAVHELAKALDLAGLDPGAGTNSAGEKFTIYDAARAFLASDWLAAYGAAERRRAVVEGAEKIERLRQQNPINGDGSNYTVDRAVKLLVGVGTAARLKLETHARWDREYRELRMRLDAQEDADAARAALPDEPTTEQEGTDR